MHRTVLYYPTIGIPNNQWLRQAVLYFDNVASIVPESLIDTKFSNKDIEYLKQEKVYTEFKPSDLFKKNNEREEFEHDIKKIIDSKEFKWELSKNPKTLDYQIHADKISYGVYEMLKDKGVVEKEDHGNWYNFEQKTALIYLSVLADHLANIHDSTIPSTDKRIYNDLLFSNKGEKSELQCSQVIFNNILPVPQKDVSLDRIIQFRKDHFIELTNFRKLIRKFEKNISTMDSLKDITEYGIVFGDDIRQQALILSEDLNQEGISSSWHSFSTLLRDIRESIKENLPSAITLATFGGKIGGPPGVLIGASAGIIPGIAEIGISLHAYDIDSRYQRRIKVRDNPLGYIYSASQEGILSNLNK